MSEIKLVVCDLDGTLLNDEKMITPYTVSVMKKVREMGIAVCLASGRDEQMMSIYEKQLGGCEYMLSDNGAPVRSGKRVICCNFLAEEDTASLLAYLNEQQMTLMMYSAEQMYFSEGSEKLKKRIRDYEALSSESRLPGKTQGQGDSPERLCAGVQDCCKNRGLRGKRNSNGSVQEVSLHSLGKRAP